MSHEDDLDYQRGHEAMQRLVRGDAMIGLVADLPALEADILGWLWAAAARGNPLAYRDLGDCYLATLREIGGFEGIVDDAVDERPWPAEALTIEDEDTPDLQAALRCYFMAALLGDPDALVLYAKNSRHSSEANQRRAAQRLEALPERGAALTYQLGLVRHWLGEHEASAAAHEEAARAGDLDAQFELSLYYTQGIGVAADAAEARRWLERAAEGNHPRALYNLGAGYATAQDGVLDLDRAAAYYRRAAEHGHARAAATLAVMTLTGAIDGTTEQAAAWLDRAEELGASTWEMLDAVGVTDPREGAGDA